MWQKNVTCDKRTVDAMLVLLNMIMKSSNLWKKKKKTTICDERIVKCNIGTAQCDIGTAQCDNRTVKCKEIK